LESRILTNNHSCVRAQVYAASALMEWGGERAEAVPRNIFELGLKTFIHETPFVLAYADWLAGVGDNDNARALFERALAAAPPDQAPQQLRPLWERYIQARRQRLEQPRLSCKNK
jgi:hypothetical protein